MKSSSDSLAFFSQSLMRLYASLRLLIGAKRNPSRNTLRFFWEVLGVSDDPSRIQEESISPIPHVYREKSSISGKHPCIQWEPMFLASATVKGVGITPDWKELTVSVVLIKCSI